jgi:hypothetical protein
VHEWLTMVVTMVVRFMCLFHQHSACIVCVCARDCVCVFVCGFFVTLCVTCNFDADARVRVSKITLKKPLTKPSLEVPGK